MLSCHEWVFLHCGELSRRGSAPCVYVTSRAGLHGRVAVSLAGMRMGRQRSFGR